MPEVLEFVGLFRLLARVWAFAVGAETLTEKMLGGKHSRASSSSSQYPKSP
jgi:hypothetical protein